MRRIGGFALLLALAGWTWACGGGGDDKTEVGPDVTETTDTTTGDTATEATAGACSKCEGMVGWGFRINALTVTEPKDDTITADEALRDFLNGMWQRDIQNDVLNIMFEITAYDPQAGTMSFKAGPGEKTLDGKYHMLCGYDVEFQLAFNPQGKGQCVFETSENTGLNFHAGPLDEPINCAPGVTDYPNAIPIIDLFAEGQLATDCQAMTGQILSAYLKGFITKANADIICYCGQYDPELKDYTCERAPQPGHERYCWDKCGSDYGSFGTTVDLFFQKVEGKGVVKNAEGVDGYSIAGFFTAERVPTYDAACCNTALCDVSVQPSPRV
jgi:hypothetical protein